jgi:hypothetical protein
MKKLINFSGTEDTGKPLEGKSVKSHHIFSMAIHLYLEKAA